MTAGRHIAFVDLAAQHRSIASEIEDAMRGVLARTDWILGEEVDAFEHEFARFCGAAGAVGTDSGLSALELALRALGVGAGDEVITAANTFIATAFAISNIGATPVLVDADPVTYNLDPDLVEAAVTSRTKAVIPVHLYGQPADMDAINSIASEHGLVVVEDACQSHGARYHGQRTGSLGHAAAFSFYPSKNLGAYGDGGIVTSSDHEVLDTVRALRNYGQRVKNRHDLQGSNHRLDTLQAAALRVKLRRLDVWNAARRYHARRYEEGLLELGVAPPTVRADVDSVYHLFVIELDARDEARALFAANGIETGVHYPVPIHLQPAYRSLGYSAGSFPVTERASERILSLPMFPELLGSDIDAVLATLGEFLAGRRSRHAA
jgi:dTDP-4-amino-4,6-dideoxygalactose transaminase